MGLYDHKEDMPTHEALKRARVITIARRLDNRTVFLFPIYVENLYGEPTDSTRDGLSKYFDEYCSDAEKCSVSMLRPLERINDSTIGEVAEVTDLTNGAVYVVKITTFIEKRMHDPFHYVRRDIEMVCIPAMQSCMNPSVYTRTMYWQDLFSVAKTTVMYYLLVSLVLFFTRSLIR